MTNFHDEVARLAYELYVKNGKINGNDLFHWLEAERLVEAWQRDQQKGREPRAAVGGKASSKTGDRKVRRKADQANGLL
jgi:hypothetical protein